ncbi:MAG: hypothetical protein HY680_03325 [Chloroflexi bacterium]|nr:hypothetical protein [Chloroflexota bacterium]
MAGLRTDGQGWFRPVSSEQNGTLYPPSYVFGSQQPAQLWDIIRVQVAGARPEPHQPENWVLAPNVWTRVRTSSPAEALRLLEPFVIPGPEIFETISDSVDYERLSLAPLASSLALVEPSEVAWSITRSPNRGARQTRAVFRLSRAPYDLPVTDPLWEQRLAGLDLGMHPRDAAGLTSSSRLFFTLSLGEPFEATGRCYKLVAAVIVL